MSPLLLACLALAVIGFGAVSRLAERSIVTPPVFFTAVGLALGADAFGFLNLRLVASQIHVLAEMTLVLVLFTDASRIDLRCLRQEASLPLRLLGIGLPLTIVAGAAAAFLCFPEVGLFEALLLAAILAPTDAALGQAVVSIPVVPVRIRQSLNVESGLNDGIALPMVLLFATLAGALEGEGSGAGHWLTFVSLQLIGGPAVGVAVGYAAGQLLARAVRSQRVNDAFERIGALAIALLAYAGAELVGGNGFIAAFAAGMTVGNTARDICGCVHEFGEAEGQLLALLIFVVFGGTMVPDAFPHWTAAIAVYAILSLTVIRMLPVALSLIGTGLQPTSIAFLGWFGPRGLATILFTLLIVEEGRLAAAPTLEATAILVVLLSALAHGATAWPLARRYGAYIEGHPDPLDAERADAMEHPSRIRHRGRRGACGARRSDHPDLP